MFRSTGVGYSGTKRPKKSQVTPKSPRESQRVPESPKTSGLLEATIALIIALVLFNGSYTYLVAVTAQLNRGNENVQR